MQSVKPVAGATGQGMEMARRPGPCGWHRLPPAIHLLDPCRAAIVAKRAMPARHLTLAVAALLLSAVPVGAEQRGEAKEQVEFGVQVAQRGLWREAIYRWERATQLDPSYAAAFNNLAVAYEHEGQLDKARTAYEKAVQLEPNNALIRQNFDLFKEINDRAAQKDGRQP
jgi:Flp pilus assembly protein TadD